MTYDLGLLLAQMPLTVILPLAVGLAVLASVIGTWIINSLYTVEQLQANNRVGAVKFQFIAEVYAVTLALALIGAFDHFTSAQTSVQREAATLEALSRAADAYDAPGQDEARTQMKTAVREYARVVVEKEWATMSFGVRHYEVDARLKELSDAFLLVEPVTAGQETVQQNTVEWVREIGELRSFRLTTVSRSLIFMVWLITVAGTALAIIFPWFFGSPNILVQGLMSCLLSAFLVLHLVVVLHLAYPFVGETSVSPQALIALAR